MLIQAIDTVSTLAGGTQPYTTTQALRLRGVDVPAGATVQLSTSQAARLLDMGVVQAQPPAHTHKTTKPKK